jgi:hypothetical protein
MRRIGSPPGELRVTRLVFDRGRERRDDAGVARAPRLLRCLEGRHGFADTTLDDGLLDQVL